MLEKLRLPGGLEGTLDSALDRALSIQTGVIVGYVDRIRRAHPHASPADVIEILERHYLRAGMAIGGASGAAAAVPGAGTVVSIASGAAEIAAFIEATALYGLCVAEVHDIKTDDPEVRRAIVLALLLGESGAALIDQAAGAGAHWGVVLTRSMSRDGVGRVNKRLAKHFIQRFGARQGALLAGRAMPLGIGAGIGVLGNRALVRAAIKTARRGFGPPPAEFLRITRST